MADARRDLLQVYIEPVRSSAPAFSSAEIGTVNGYTIVVTFNKNISASNYGTGVTIKVNTISTSITSATRQSNHAVVRYVIPIPYHGSGDTITWEYNAAVGNIVAESGAVALANVSAQTVTNNITWAALLDLQADTGVTTSVTGFAGTGTAAQLDNDVTGIGTAFLSEVVIGDVITGVGINGTVTAIADNTNLTLSSSATAGAVTFTITPQAATARVTTWADQSGTSHNFTRTGTARPSKQTITSYPALVFDGVNDWMDGSNFADNLNSFTVIAIARRDGDLHYGAIISKADTSQKGWTVARYGRDLYIQDTDGDNYIDVLEPNTGNDAFTVMTLELLNLATNSAHVYINGDNSSETDLSFGTVPEYSVSDNVKIGVVNASFANCDIRTILVFTPFLPATDRAALEIRVGARYGITI